MVSKLTFYPSENNKCQLTDYLFEPKDFTFRLVSDQISPESPSMILKKEKRHGKSLKGFRVVSVGRFGSQNLGLGVEIIDFSNKKPIIKPETLDDLRAAKLSRRKFKKEKRFLGEESEWFGFKTPDDKIFFLSKHPEGFVYKQLVLK